MWLGLTHLGLVAGDKHQGLPHMTLFEKVAGKNVKGKEQKMKQLEKELACIAVAEAVEDYDLKSEEELHS